MDEKEIEDIGFYEFLDKCIIIDNFYEPGSFPIGMVEEVEKVILEKDLGGLFVGDEGMVAIVIYKDKWTEFEQELKFMAEKRGLTLNRFFGGFGSKN